MTNAVIANIHNALNTQLSTITGTHIVQWPGTEVAPAINSTYLRPTLIPATTTLNTLNNTQVHKGIYQVDVFAPSNQGIYTLLLLADKVLNQYKGQSLTSGTETVHIQAVGAGRLDRDGAWLKSYVEIYYICYS